MDRDQRLAGVRSLFDLLAPEYDNVGIPFFRPIADGLVETVRARPGDRALDVGCGNGVSSAPLASAVAPDGSVVAIDLSPAMVERAREKLEGLLADVEVHVGDASDPGLPPKSFDTVISSLVVFFLPDPAAAVANWVRLLAPGGRIGISTFGRSNPEWQALEGELREYLPPIDPRMVGLQSPFASDAGMAALLTDAGAVDVQTSFRRVEFAFESFDHWVRFSRSVGQRVAWERMSADDTARVLDRTGRLFAEAAGPDGGLPAFQEVRYTVGSAPGPV